MRDDSAPRNPLSPAAPADHLAATAPPLAAAAASKTVEMSQEKKMREREKEWNTKNLGWRLAADAASGLTAASVVAPVISIIDRSIMENASGRNTLLNCLTTSLKTLLLRPHQIILAKPFALICMVYGGTYLTANALDTATSTTRNKPATHVTHGTAKFAASSAANVGLCIYKDQVFVRMFGPPGVGVPRPVTLPSYALFTIRDCMTIFASFNVPPLLGPYINARVSAEARRSVSGQSIAQFVAPAAIQLVSTPMHLLGLDIYNRPWTAKEQAPRFSERWDAVRKNWAISAAARICRIVPAFGVGGVINTNMRQRLMEKLA